MEIVNVVVSGSFTKAKPEIDQAIYIFKLAGWNVLSPESGRLYKPFPNSQWSKGAYPLRSERLMTEFEAKFHHHQSITSLPQDNSLLYLVLVNGRIGIDTAFETGLATGKGIPVFSNEVPDPRQEPFEPFWRDHIQPISVYSPEQLITSWRVLKRKSGGGWVQSANNLWLPS